MITIRALLTSESDLGTDMTVSIRSRRLDMLHNSPTYLVLSMIPGVDGSRAERKGIPCLQVPL